MEINAQDVIDRLSAKLGKAETDRTIMEIQIEALQAQLRQNESGENPVEGELID